MGSLPKDKLLCWVGLVKIKGLQLSFFCHSMHSCQVPYYTPSELQKAGSNFSTRTSSRASLRHPPWAAEQAPPPLRPAPARGGDRPLLPAPPALPEPPRLRLQAAERRMLKKPKPPPHRAWAAQGPPKFLFLRERSLTAAHPRRLLLEDVARTEIRKTDYGGV